MTNIDDDPSTYQLPLKVEEYVPTPEEIAMFASPEQDPETTERLKRILAEAAIERQNLPDLEISGDEEDDFVQSLRTFQKQFQIPEDAEVIYPGSATNVGPDRVFGKDHVTHVDPDQRAVDALEKHGYQAVPKGISEYDPDKKGDVMVALNSYGRLSPEDVERLLNDGGYLVTNNYTGWASDAADMENLSLVGTMLPRYSEGGAFLEGDAIPEGATDIVTRYYRSPGGKGLVKAEPNEPGAWSDDSARYPDGLFIFRKTA